MPEFFLIKTHSDGGHSRDSVTDCLSLRQCRTLSNSKNFIRDTLLWFPVSLSFFNKKTINKQNWTQAFSIPWFLQCKIQETTVAKVSTFHVRFRRQLKKTSMIALSRVINEYLYTTIFFKCLILSKQQCESGLQPFKMFCQAQFTILMHTTSLRHGPLGSPI